MSIIFSWQFFGKLIFHHTCLNFTWFYRYVFLEIHYFFNIWFIFLLCHLVAGVWSIEYRDRWFMFIACTYWLSISQLAVVYFWAKIHDIQVKIISCCFSLPSIQCSFFLDPKIRQILQQNPDNTGDFAKRLGKTINFIKKSWENNRFCLKIMKKR